VVRGEGEAMTWRQQNGVMTYAKGATTATVRREGSRFYLIVKRNGTVLREGYFRSMTAAQNMAEFLAQ
jgi:hypothetical protein